MNSKEKKVYLLKIADEIKLLIKEKQDSLELSFVEDTHIYYMRNTQGELVSNYPSVSTVIKQFYNEFPELTKSLDMCNGDIVEQDKLLNTWRLTSNYANSKGSRVHYFLEMDLLKMYNNDKEVRKPIFDCDEEQIKDGNAMIDAGHDFIRLMHRRGAVLLDTEMVLGSPELGYTGQPDKVWLMMNENSELGFIVTDWKTNKPKNFQVHHYTEKMLPPFENYWNTSLSHYMIQLPLYARLILNMLKGSKYGDLKLFGCVIVHLTMGGKFQEFRVPKKFYGEVLTMDPLPRIGEVLTKKKKGFILENERKEKLKLISY